MRLMHSILHDVVMSLVLNHEFVKSHSRVGSGKIRSTPTVIRLFPVGILEPDLNSVTWFDESVQKETDTCLIPILTGAVTSSHLGKGRVCVRARYRSGLAGSDQYGVGIVLPGSA